MTTINKQSKSILSRLLASENIHVLHDVEAKTASFDVQKRVLRLPVFKDMSEEMYDMFVGHEVSHALYTPFTDEDAKSIKENGCLNAAFIVANGDRNMVHIAHQYMNVVEDARIERLIKNKFNGLRRDFYIGYGQLHERDFFGIAKENVEDMAFIDRINLFFKIGSIINVPFSDEEMVFVHMVENTRTFDDVVEVTKKIWEYVKEKNEGNPQSGTDIEFAEDPDGDSANGKNVTETEGKTKTDGKTGSSGNGSSAPAAPQTQKNFDKAMQDQFIKEETNHWEEPQYYALPTTNLDNVIVDFSTVLREFDTIATTYPVGYMKAEEDAKEFIRDSKRVVNILAQEFLAKKAAKDHHRSSINRTGMIDSVRMMNYKFSDDIFKRMKIVKKGKSHGMVFFLDMSGSMSSIYEDTIKQLIQLVLFCDRVSIPFEVFGFTTRTDALGNEEGLYDYEQSNFYWKQPNVPPMYNCKTMQAYNLVNIFSSRMKKQQLNTMIRNMMAVGTYYSRTTYSIAIPSRMYLSSTPLCEAIVTAIDFVPMFKAKNNLDIVNTIFLTDGEPTGYGFNPNQNTFLYKNGQTFKYDTRFTLESNMISIFRQLTGLKAISFYLNESKNSLSMYTCDINRGIVAQNSGNLENFSKKETSYIKEGWTTSFSHGHKYNEKFIIRGNNSVEYIDIEQAIGSRKTNSAICNNFIKALSKNMVSRVMLNRFVDLIASE